MRDFVAPTKEEFDSCKAWGLLTSVDIHNCNHEIIRDADAIKRFVKELCEKIMVRRYGETEVVEFGDDPRVHGYSMMQLIESSLISAHFAEQTNSVYLDVFSCKYYDPVETVNFSMKFFEGKYCEALSVLRGCARSLPEEYREKLRKRNVILQSDMRESGNGTAEETDLLSADTKLLHAESKSSEVFG